MYTFKKKTCTHFKNKTCTGKDYKDHQDYVQIVLREFIF